MRELKNDAIKLTCPRGHQTIVIIEMQKGYYIYKCTTCGNRHIYYNFDESNIFFEPAYRVRQQDSIYYQESEHI
jgi:hypothetical protein